MFVAALCAIAKTWKWFQHPLINGASINQKRGGKIPGQGKHTYQVLEKSLWPVRTEELNDTMLKISKVGLSPGQCGSVGWSVIPQTKRSQGIPLVRAHTQGMGSIPGQGEYRKATNWWTDSFSLSLLLSLSLSLSLSGWELKKKWDWKNSWEPDHVRPWRPCQGLILSLKVNREKCKVLKCRSHMIQSVL